MEIKTDRLFLKNYNYNNLNNYVELKSEPLIWKYSSKIPITDYEVIKKELDMLINSYSSNKFQFQALYLKESLEYIGEAGIISYNNQNNRAVIGYNILPKYWNKGYATEISKELIKYLLNDLQTNRIEALVFEDNIASRKVLEKLGFKLEGILRDFAYNHKEYWNVCYYGLIKADYMLKS